MEQNGIVFDLRGLATELKERLLAVPIYQRSYAWSLDEVGEFWFDLRSAFAEGATEYFLGTIVLTRQGLPPRDTVIDGQQRLATTTVLLAAIRDEYRRLGDQKRGDIVQQYLSTSDLASATEVSRLQMNSEDAFFFDNRIVLGQDKPDPSKPSHTLLLSAYAYFSKELKKVTEDAGTAWSDRLIKWVDFLKARVRAIVLEVPSEADAFLIFETLNDRGADLTIADLLKNYLFGRAGGKLDAVRDGWMQVLGALEIAAENKLFTSFLRQYWSSRHGAIRERELFKSIKERVTTEAQVVELINDLQNAAVLYAALLNSDHEYWDSLGATVKENVQTLLRLELEQHRPVLLAALQHFIDAEKRKLLRAIVSWSVRGLIVGGIGGGTAEKNYCRAAVKVRKGDIKTTDELLTEISSIVPSDDDFRTSFATARVPKGAIARYYLIALENGNKNEKEPELVPNANEEKVNLEHVLPRRALDKDWGASFALDERKDYLHRLGNLALLQKGPNGRIGNKPFADKKPVLAASAFELTKLIGSKADWTKTAIKERQDLLAALAVNVWQR